MISLLPLPLLSSAYEANHHPPPQCALDLDVPKQAPLPLPDACHVFQTGPHQLVKETINNQVVSPTKPSATTKELEGLQCSSDEASDACHSFPTEPQLVKETTARINFIDQRICEFYEAYCCFEEKYVQWKKDFSELGNFQVNILALLDYYNFNHDNLLYILQMLLSTDQYHVIASELNVAGLVSKCTAYLMPLAFGLNKYNINKQIRCELNALQKRLEELQPHLMAGRISEAFSASKREILLNIQRCIEALNDQIKEDRKEAIAKVRSGFFNSIPKVLQGISHKQANKISRSVVGLLKWTSKFSDVKEAFNTHHQLLFHLQPRILVDKNPTFPRHQQEGIYHEAENFLSALKNCSSLQEVKRKLKEIGIKDLVCTTFNQWQNLKETPRFRRYIIQTYYYKKSYRPRIDPESLRALLSRRAQEKQCKVQQGLSFVYDQVKECQNKGWEDIKKHLKDQHLDINQVKVKDALLKVPPSNKEEWMQCIQNQEFCQALANQWVDYQETIGLTAKQVFLQGLLSKHQVEKKFLNFRKISSFIHISSSIIPAIICLPIKHTIKSILKLLVTDFVKMGVPILRIVSVCQLLYPTITFKLDALSLLLAEHFFASSYKPNMYSLEGYKLLIEIYRLELGAIKDYFLLLFQHTVLWLNMRLINQCIMRFEKKPLNTDDRFNDIYRDYERQRLNYRQEAQKLEEEMKRLRLKDFKLMFCFHDKQAESDDKDGEPLRILIEHLEKAKPQFFTPETLEFFHEHLGIDLTKTDQERLQEVLEDFFVLNEDEFVNAHQRHRRDYCLKA